MKKKVTSFSLPPDLVQWLADESKKQRRSVSSLVAQLVDKEMKKDVNSK